jgi:hypothetical protein
MGTEIRDHLGQEEFGGSIGQQDSYWSDKLGAV